MSITHTYAAKLFGAFVAAAMLLTLVAPAQAQTTEELQQMINDLLAQVASLQGQIGGQSTGMGAADVCPYTWTRDLTIGATGNDVLLLQQFLNADAETRVAATGVGAAGQETDYYGALTGAAVAKFQSKYRAEILSPLGLVNATTYFGASSRAKANALCSTSAPSTPGDDDDDMDDDDDVELGGIATLDSADMNDGDDTDLEEGQDDAPVAELELEFNNGDARISIIDVALVGTGDEQDPWDTFDEVSLWVDGDKIADVAADDEDEYLDEDDGSLRFSGLDLVAMEDEEVTIVIAVTVQNSVDLGGDADAWTIQVDQVRYFDAQDVATNENTFQDIGTDGAVDFDIDEEGGEDELNIRSASEDPDATTLAVEENSNSDWHTVFAFNLDTDDSVNDIVVETAVVRVIVAGDVYEQVVRDAELVIDGETFDDVTVTGEGTATATLTFDIDKDLEIDAGDEVLAELRLQFLKQTGNYAEGQTVQATTTAALGWEAEGADDLDSTQLSGSAVGEVHSLRTEGIIVEPGDHETDTQGDNDTVGIFEIEFEVTAFEEDVYIAENATSSGVSTDGGVDFTVEGPSGFAATTSGTLSSTGDEDTDGVFTVREGETETFVLTVSVDPNTTGQYRVLLNDIWFTSNSDGVSSLQTDPATPASDYRTGYVNIQAS